MTEPKHAEAAAIDWSNTTVLITGGTGSFGKKFTEILLRTRRPKKLIRLMISLRGRHVTVTGSAGFLGSHVVTRTRDRGRGGTRSPHSGAV